MRYYWPMSYWPMTVPDPADRPVPPREDDDEDEW